MRWTASSVKIIWGEIKLEGDGFKSKRRQFFMPEAGPTGLQMVLWVQKVYTGYGKIGQSFGREASQRLLYRGTRAGTASPLSWKWSKTETLTRRCKCRLILPWLCTAGLFSRLNIGVDCTGDRWGVSSILMELCLKSKKKSGCWKQSLCKWITNVKQFQVHDRLRSLLCYQTINHIYKPLPLEEFCCIYFRWLSSLT